MLLIINLSMGEIYNDSEINIGRHNIFNSVYFTGSLDNISIWGRILNNQEKQYYPLMEVIGTEVDLISYWNFNEGVYDLVEDVSSNNDGLIFGATWSEDVPIGCNDPLAENYDEGTQSLMMEVVNILIMEIIFLDFNGQDDYIGSVTSSLGLNFG